MSRHTALGKLGGQTAKPNDDDGTSAEQDSAALTESTPEDRLLATGELDGLQPPGGAGNVRMRPSA